MGAIGGVGPSSLASLTRVLQTAVATPSAAASTGGPPPVDPEAVAAILAAGTLYTFLNVAGGPAIQAVSANAQSAGMRLDASV